MEAFKTESQQSSKRGFPPPPFIPTVKDLTQDLFFPLLALFFNHIGQPTERDLQAVVIGKREVERVLLISDVYGAPAYQREFVVKTGNRICYVLVSEDVWNTVNLHQQIELRFKFGNFTEELKGVAVIPKNNYG